MSLTGSSTVSRRRWEAADAVIASSLLLLAAVFGVFAFLVWQGYEQTVQQAHDRALASATIVADDAGATISRSLDLLTYVAATVSQNRDAPLPANVGFVPVEQLSTEGPEADIAAGETWAVSTRANTQPIRLARRVERDGQLIGAATLTLQDTFLQTLWTSLALGPQSTVGLLRTDGKLVARIPRPEQSIDLAGMPVLGTLTGAPRGSYASPSSPADGLARIVGFRSLDDLGLVAIASVSQDAVVENLWHATRVVLFLMVPIGLALLLGSFLTARLLRKSTSQQRSLAAALEQNQLLFREIHHRVKNNLQSVNALLNLHPIPREIKAELGQRIAAMSAVHEHIYRSNNFATVELAPYLQTLVDDLRSGLAPRITVETDFADVHVDSDTATPVGLIFSEAVSNAIKHAFGDGREGRLTLRLAVEDQTGVLTVRDNGVGYDPEAPATGIGRKLILALSRQIGGEVRFTSGEGSLFELRFPLRRDG